jgi:class 3 adenylate cyclase
MDRHDLPEAVTAEAVAKVHQEDLKIQQQFGCRGLTYWFDENRKTAFCLIEAPEKKAVSEMHNKVHGMIPNRIIEVDSSVVNAFLGRIENPAFAANSYELEKNIINESAFRTILISKISDFAILKAKFGKSKVALFVDFHKNTIRKAIKRHGGREVKYMRDGFIISFSSSLKALNCAKEIQNNITNLNNPEIQIRCGLSAGPPVTESAEFFGQAVNLAQRLCNAGTSGHIMVSAEIKEQMLEESSNAFIDKKIIALNQKDEEFLNHVMNIIESCWDNISFDINSFSRKSGLSKAQLYRKLTSLCGYSPNDFIKEYRLKKTLESIEKQKGNVAEIAYQSGYSSPSYFSKCFLKRFGILPSAFAASVV